MSWISSQGTPPLSEQRQSQMHEISLIFIDVWTTMRDVCEQKDIRRGALGGCADVKNVSQS